MCLCVCVCVCVCVSLCVYVSLSVSLSLSLVLFLSVSLYPSICLILSITLPLHPFICLDPSTCFSLYLDPSIPFSFCLYLFLSLSLYLSVSIFTPYISCSKRSASLSYILVQALAQRAIDIAVMLFLYKPRGTPTRGTPIRVVPWCSNRCRHLGQAAPMSNSAQEALEERLHRPECNALLLPGGAGVHGDPGRCLCRPLRPIDRVHALQELLPTDGDLALAG